MQKSSVFEHAQMARGRWPRVRKAFGDVTCRRYPIAKMEREQDLSPRRVRDRRDNLIERFELLFGVQTGSTSQIVSSSSTGPIGSHTAITSGV